MTTTFDSAGPAFGLEKQPLTFVTATGEHSVTVEVAKTEETITDVMNDVIAATTQQPVTADA